MVITLIEAILTAASHVLAAVSLAPLRYSRRKTCVIWVLWAAVIIGLSCFMPSVRQPRSIYGFAAFFGSCLVHALFFLLTTRGRFGERCFLFLSYTAFFVACCAVTQFFRCFILPEDDTGIFLIVYGVSLALMMYIFLYRLLPVFRQSARYIDRGWRLLSLLTGLYMLAFTGWFLYPNSIGDYTLRQAVGLPILIILFFITYAVILVCVRNIAAAETAKQMKLQLELLSAQVAAQKQFVAETRRARHDLRHHNLVMLSLAKDGKYDELIRYLESADTTQTAAETVYCENDTLNSILSVYRKKAEALGISADILAQAEKDIGVSSSDLVAIIANLFENAIHGASESSGNKYIIVRIRPKSGKLVIRFENSCPAGRVFKSGMPKDMFGIGMSSITASAGKYDGEYSFSSADGVFTSMVMLNLA